MTYHYDGSIIVHHNEKLVTPTDKICKKSNY